MDFAKLSGVVCLNQKTAWTPISTPSCADFSRKPSSRSKVAVRRPPRGRADKEQEIARRVEERMAQAYVSVPQMLRPMVLGLEAVSRAAGENSVVLQKLDKASEQAIAAQCRSAGA